MTARTEDWTGIEKRGGGYRARVSRGRGRAPIEKHFGAGTTWQEMQAWRKDEKARQRLKRKQRASLGSFEGDVRKKYLPAVEDMPTYNERVGEMEWWIERLGTTPTDDITTVGIRAVLNRARVEPRKRRKYEKEDKKLDPLGAARLNKLKRALQNFFTVLFADADPPRRNPVKPIPDFDEPDAVERDIPYDKISKILTRMANHAGGWKKGETKDKHEPSDVSIVAGILAYTGMEPKQLEGIDKSDVDLEIGFVKMPRRKKGKRSNRKKAGIEILPLVPPAVAYFQEYDRRGLWKKKVQRSALRKGFKAAAEREGIVDKIRIKDLRHSFGTIVVETTQDLQLAQDLLMHSTAAMTKRYSARVIAKMLKAKLDPVGRHFGSTPGLGTSEPVSRHPALSSQAVNH